MEKLFRSKLGRLALTVLLVGAGVWGFWPYVFDEVADTAFVDAHITRIVTPVSGTAAGQFPSEGEFLAQSRKLDLVLGAPDGAAAPGPGFAPVLPADHLVWGVQSQAGAPVAAGQTLLELADCRNPIVVVEMPARMIERLKLGDQARVRLLGSDQWMDGSVQRIVGGTSDYDPSMAVTGPTPHPRTFRAEVVLTTPRSPDASRSCDIGRQAEVRFSRGWTGGLFRQVLASVGLSV